MAPTASYFLLHTDRKSKDALDVGKLFTRKPYKHVRIHMCAFIEHDFFFFFIVQMS